MQAQTFRAASFEAAMTQVRRALGPDALIVTRRHLTDGRGLRSGPPEVEITAISAGEAARSGLGSEQVSLPDMLQRRLLRGGVPEGTAHGLAQRLRFELARLGTGPDAQQQALAATLAHEMVFAPSVGDSVRVAVMVGPTGVGKTTTIAKLAARAALLERKRVALVCLDHYRIGGMEQLQRYADLIGIPMHVAHDGRSLAFTLVQLSGADLVLVDTAGRSPRHGAALSELRGCLDAAREKIEIYLCLQVAMRAQEIMMVVEQQGLVEPTRLIGTKVDEAICSSGLIAAQAASGLPLSYITTGQRVPEDIEVASPELLASLLSGAEVSSS